MAVFTTKASGVPAGAYTVEFSDYEQSVHEAYGDRVSWKCTVVEGPHKDAVTSRYTGASLTPKSAFMKVIVRGMLGRALNPGETFNPDAFLGKRFLAVVEETDSGATRIASLTPLEAAPATVGGSVPF